MEKLYLLLKATVTKVITVPGYTRADGIFVPPHQKTVHYDPDKSKHDIIHGNGTSSQQKAHQKLSKLKDWEKWSDEEKHAHVLSSATNIQVKKTFNGNVSKFKKAILEGKVPQAGHYNAVMSDEMGEEKRQKLLNELKEKVGTEKVESLMNQAAKKAGGKVSGQKVAKDKYNEHSHKLAESHKKVADEEKAKQGEPQKQDEAEKKTDESAKDDVKQEAKTKQKEEPKNYSFENADKTVESAKDAGCSKWLVGALEKAKDKNKKISTDLLKQYLMYKGVVKDASGETITKQDIDFYQAHLNTLKEKLKDILDVLKPKESDSEEEKQLKLLVNKIYNGNHGIAPQEAAFQYMPSIISLIGDTSKSVADKAISLEFMMPTAKKKGLFAELKNAQEQTAKQEDGSPKDGDTKTENGVTYVLKDGRWHKLSKDTKEPESTKQETEPAASTEGTAKDDPAHTQTKLHQFNHTKTGEQIYSVKLADKATKDQFQSAKNIAKDYDGYYSSYNKGGAISGFHFKNEKNAKGFQDEIENLNFFPEHKAKEEASTTTTEQAKPHGNLINPKEGQSIGEAALETVGKMVSEAEGSLSDMTKKGLQTKLAYFDSGWMKSAPDLYKIKLCIRECNVYKEAGVPSVTEGDKALSDKLEALYSEIEEKMGYKGILDPKEGDAPKTLALKKILKDSADLKNGYNPIEAVSVYKNMDGIKEILASSKTPLQKVNAVKKLVKQDTGKSNWKKLVELGKPQKNKATNEKPKEQQESEDKLLASLPESIGTKLSSGYYKGLTTEMVAGAKNLADETGDWDKFVNGQMGNLDAYKMLEELLPLFGWKKGGYLHEMWLSNFVIDVKWNKTQGKPVDDSPKEGDTKQGKGGTLVFHNGHWVLMDEASAKEGTDGLKEVHISELTAPDIPDISGWKQVGGQKGSNAGGTFEDESGQKWYCKFPDDGNHAKSEVLAGELYKACGIKTAETKIISKDGKIGIASKFIDGLKSDKDKVGALTGAKAGFAVDAWLGNWDAVGLGYDNLLSDGKGNAVRIDVGGSLEYRAQGQKKGKDFGDTIPEVKSMMDPSKNPQTAHVFSGMTESELGDSVRNVLKLSDESIKNIVNSFGPGDENAKEALAKKLIARKNDLAKQFPEIAKDYQPKSVIKIEEPPDFNNYYGSGPLSSKPWKNEQNNDVVKQIYEAIKEGGREAVDNLKFDLKDENGNIIKHDVPLSEHPSQKVQSYATNVKMSADNPVIQEPDGIVHVQPKSKGGVWSKISGIMNKVKYLKDSIKKIGRYAVLGRIVGGNLGDMIKFPKYDSKEQTAIKKQLASQSKKNFDKLSALEKKAIKSYTGSGYQSLNPNVVGGNIGKNEKALIEGMEKAAVEIPEGFVTSRRITLNAEEMKALIGAEGLVLQDFNGAISTAYNPNVWSGNVQLRITCGAGVKGLMVAGDPETKTGVISSVGSGETEIMLPHSTRFYVRKVYPKGTKFKDEYGLWGGDYHDGGHFDQHVIEVVALPG